MAGRPRIAIPIPTTIDEPYNARCAPLYAAAIARAGGEPVELTLDAAGLALGKQCAGVLLPGSLADVDPSRYGQPRSDDCGPPDRAREETDFALLEHAQHTGQPVLGICYGLQTINVWRGGSLVQDLLPKPVNHAAGAAVGVAHMVQTRGGSRLDGIVAELGGEAGSARERLPVNSSHHQAVALPGEGLRVSARCADDGVIEALEADADGSEGLLLAVQWHPERSYDTSAVSRALFALLVREAQR